MSNVLQLGIEAHQAGELADARRLYEQAISVASHNLGVLADQLGRHEEGIARYQQALAADPTRHESAVGVAYSLLREGRFEEAWPYHERRRHLPKARLLKVPDHWPEWMGEDLTGKRLGVLGEQGFGDQIQFARFMDVLRDRGVDVRFAGGAELVPLLGGQEGLARGEIDCWAYVLSLPFRMGVTAENIPPPVRLPVAWRGGGGVGVMASGRTIFDRYGWAQKTDIQAQMLALGRDLRPEATGARDFLETAKIVAGLDLVITIDTAVAHLAGSIGVPTWVILPVLNADWRWHRGRTDSPWYPTVRLFRQPKPGDWAGALEEVRAELSRLHGGAVA